MSRHIIGGEVRSLLVRVQLVLVPCVRAVRALHLFKKSRQTKYKNANKECHVDEDGCRSVRPVCVFRLTVRVLTGGGAHMMF